MKKSVIAVFALAVMLFASSANANLIGLFGDPDATTCARPFPLYTTTVVHVVAVLSDIPAITAAEFIVCNVVQDPAQVIITPAWNSPLTIGNVFGPGFSIAFSTPQAGPIVPLGTISFFVINAAWPGTDIIWCVCETEDSQVIVLVDDQFVAHDAIGWCFVANCTPGGPYGDCDCFSIPTEDTSWGAVKSLY